MRKGIYVYLRQKGIGKIGVGEIAPLPWFGTETWQDAVTYCAELPRTLTQADIQAVPTQLPCMQFGIGMAYEAMYRRPDRPEKIENETLPICGLLPAGQNALTDWNSLWEQGHRTLKWKIGVAAIEDELDLLRSLTKVLPPVAKLRLDANGGLTHSEAVQWALECDRINANPANLTIEYLEQPLPPDQWRSLLTLASESQTPIALDESVATLKDLETWQQRKWLGYYVIKPLIMGFPWRIRQVCGGIDNPKVFSSVFESDIGKVAALELAQELGTDGLALGFGVDHWLAESPSVSISSSIFS